MLNPQVTKCLCDMLINENEITEIVYSLNESSADWDSIPAFVAKATIQSYIKPLTSLINSSFENGIFPGELKITKVIPKL